MYCQVMCLLISSTSVTLDGSLLSPVSDTIPSKLAAALWVDHTPECHDPFRESTGLGVIPDQYLSCDELSE